MKMRDKNDLLQTLLGAGLYLLDPVRDRLSGRMGDFAERAQDGYEEASDRLGRATRALRGEDSHIWGSLTALLIGVGVGVGVGMLLAPASGEETRSSLAGKMQDVTEKVKSQAQGVTERVRSQFSERQSQGSTGTYGQ